MGEWGSALHGSRPALGPKRWLRLRLGMALDFAVDPSERVHVTDGHSAGLGNVWPMWSNGALR
jgi:hypothetical protein